jgi:hypothetical protein
MLEGGEGDGERGCINPHYNRVHPAGAVCLPARLVMVHSLFGQPVCFLAATHQRVTRDARLSEVSVQPIRIWIRVVIVICWVNWSCRLSLVLQEGFAATAIGSSIGCLCPGQRGSTSRCI